MTDKFKRTLARITLPFVVLFLSLLPGQAYAFVPASIGGYGLPTVTDAVAAAGGAGSAGAIGAVDILAAGGLIAVGASISYFGIDYLVGPDTYTYRIPLRADSPVPEPSAAPTASMYTKTYYSCCDGSVSDTLDSICPTVADFVYTPGIDYYNQQLIESTTSQMDAGVCYAIVTSGGIVYPRVATPDISQTTVVCPDGYISDGAGSCTLQDARTATPDKACDLVNTGSALQKLSNDTDCAALPQQDLDCSSGACVITGPNINGQPRRIVVEVSPGGGAVITAQDQRMIGNTPVIDSRTVAVSSAGVVTSSTSGTVTGTLPVDGTAPASGTTVTPTDSPTTTLPTDYARTGEAAAAAKTITDADTAWRNGEQQRWNDRLGTAPTAEPIPSSTYDVTITAVPFASNAACPSPIAFNALGTDYSISYQPACDLMSTMRPLFLAMGAFAAAYVFFQGLKA